MRQKSEHSKAQISAEYIMLLGVLLFLLIPVIYYALSHSQNSVRLNQAGEVVSALSKAADSVYSAGPGNTKYVWITVPSGTKMAITSNEIMLKLSIFGSQSDIHESTKAALVPGTIGGVLISADANNPTAIGKGTYNVKVEMQESSVLIGD